MANRIDELPPHQSSLLALNSRRQPTRGIKAMSVSTKNGVLQSWRAHEEGLG